MAVAVPSYDDFFALVDAGKSPPTEQVITTSRPERGYEIVEVTTLKQLDEVLNWVATHDEVGLDCEACSPDPARPELGKNPMVAVPLLCQIGDDTISYVVVLPAFTFEELEPLWKRLPYHVIVGHNMDYDYRLLRSYYMVPKWRSVYDTQLAEALLTAGDYGSKGMWLKLGLSLKVVAHKYLDIELDKEERNTFALVDPTTSQFGKWRPTATQLKYAGLDTIITMRVANEQVIHVESENLQRAAQSRFAALVPFAEVEMRGMKIDAVKWREYLAELEIELQKTEAELSAALDKYEQQYRARKLATLQAERDEWDSQRKQHELKLRADWEKLSTSLVQTANTLQASLSEMSPSNSTPNIGPTTVVPWGQYKVNGMREFRVSHPNPGTPKVDDGPINLNSTEQVKRAYKAMGVTLPITLDKETGKLKESCDSKARERLLASGSLSPTQSRVLRLHSTFSKLSKLKGSFGENILSQLTATGRLHTNYNIGLTETGRASSEGPNFQNFPRTDRLRNCFIADDGYVVITADFKSQELAIAAARSGDKRMAQELSEGLDLYKQLAVEVFGLKSESEVTKDQRHAAKSGLLGVSYGLTPIGMERIHGIPQALGKRVISAIKVRYPALFAYAETNAKAAISQGYVTTALGAKRYFRDKHAEDWEIENQGKNAPIQGTAGDIVYVMADRLERYAVPHGILPVNFVHDEAVVLCPREKQEWGQKLVVEQMQAAFNDVLPYEEYGVICGVDVHVAPYWTKD
jgi:DNA polymerase I-like protein with 3'-5' exonuclease and polymerase domains